jgi:hypothetical protein
MALLIPVSVFAEDLSALMPEKVGELYRIQLLTGDAAQAEVDKLHGKALSATASVVARYSRTSDVGKVRPAEVWVSQVSSEKEARRQTGQMVHMMYENPRSPFKNPKRIEHGGQSVYRFVGMGQVHFIWFKGDLVFWISANPADESLMLGCFAN